MILWRIAAETRKYPTDDLSGGGAAVSPGRWNDDGQAQARLYLNFSVPGTENAAFINIIIVMNSRLRNEFLPGGL